MYTNALAQIPDVPGQAYMYTLPMWVVCGSVTTDVLLTPLSVGCTNTIHTKVQPDTGYLHN